MQSADLLDSLYSDAVDVGLYYRISEDIDELAPGVARQEEDCRKLADLRSWSGSKVYQGNDVALKVPNPVGRGT
jgi:site-specific DNA recombinase